MAEPPPEMPQMLLLQQRLAKSQLSHSATASVAKYHPEDFKKGRHAELPCVFMGTSVDAIKEALENFSRGAYASLLELLLEC